VFPIHDGDKTRIDSILKKRGKYHQKKKKKKKKVKNFFFFFLVLWVGVGFIPQRKKTTVGKNRRQRDWGNATRYQKKYEDQSAVVEEKSSCRGPI